MSAGDRDAVPVAHQFGEHFGALDHRDARVAGGHQLRVGGRHRRRLHHHVGTLDLLGAMTDPDLRAQLAQPPHAGVFGQVGAGDRVALVAQHLGDAAKACAADRVHLLVLGGSLGARALNHAVPAALARLPAAERPLVRHQCGADHLDAARAAYRAAGIEAEVVPFIDDMAAAYRWADLAICRAGALTVAELAAAGLPAILVPFPHAIDDHQYHNGQWLAQAGAALLIREAELDPPRLAVALDALLGDAARRAAMAAGARALALPAAARVVADACLEVAR